MAAISPMISIVVKPHAIGSAYGLMSSLINIGLSFGPLLIGALTKPNEKENAYANVNIFFAWVSWIGIFFQLSCLFLTNTKWTHFFKNHQNIFNRHLYILTQMWFN